MKALNLNWAASLLLAAVVILLTSGCTGRVERKWSEEVQLDDGSVVLVDRYVKFQESNSLSGDAYSSTMEQSTLKFKGDLSGLAPWDVPLVPLVLYRDGQAGDWVIVATTYSCDVWALRGSPAPPYWEFRLKANQWIQSPLSPTSLGRESNLFFNFEPALPVKSLSRELKGEIVRKSNFAKEYKSIGANVRSNCMAREN